MSILPSFVGKYASGLGNAFTGNASSAKAAKRAWIRTMEASNTSYQRGVADMKAAGLNPMLAYSQGGASTPQAQPAEVRAAGGELVKAYTGWSGARAQTMVAQATTANLQANTAKTAVDTQQAENQVKLSELEYQQKLKTNPEAAKQAESETKIKSAAVDQAAENVKILKTQLETANTALAQQKAMNPLLQAAADLGNKAAKQGLDIGELNRQIAELKLELLPKPETASKVKKTIIDAWDWAVNWAADQGNEYKFKGALMRQKLDETLRRKKEGHR